MIYTIEQIKDKVVPIAVKYNLPAMYLFGSYARGEANEHSDVDFMIDRTGTKVHGLYELAAVYNDLEETLEKKIDLLTTDGVEQNRVRHPQLKFAETLDRERIVLYEKQ